MHLFSFVTLMSVFHLFSVNIHHQMKTHLQYSQPFCSAASRLVNLPCDVYHLSFWNPWFHIMHSIPHFPIYRLVVLADVFTLVTLYIRTIPV